MTETDNAWSQEDDSWRKQTLHVEMVGRPAGFLLSPQSSALSPYFPGQLTPEPLFYGVLNLSGNNRLISASVALQTPRSVIKPVTNFAGVTSNA